MTRSNLTCSNRTQDERCSSQSPGFYFLSISGRLLTKDFFLNWGNYIIINFYFVCIPIKSQPSSLVSREVVVNLEQEVKSFLPSPFRCLVAKYI